jgi:hypothetical protein
LRGKSIADIAKDKNIDVNKVIDALVADAQARIDKGKADGKITQQQADMLGRNLKDRITSLVNGTRPAGGAGFPGFHGFGRHGFGGPGGGPDGDADDTATTVTPE